MNRPYPLSHHSPERALERREYQGYLPRGYIDGLILSNNGSDATNDIDIAAGVCRSTSNRVNGVISTLAKDQRDIEIPAALTKQLDVVWAPGNGGGRSAESLADASWHWYAIGGRGMPDSVIALSSISSLAVIHAAIPQGYTAVGRIGSVIRSTSILAFSQRGDHFLLNVAVENVENTADHTTAASATLTTPAGIITTALVRVIILAGGSGGVLLSSLAVADAAPSLTDAPGMTLGAIASDRAAGETMVRTNTSSAIRYRASASTIDTWIFTYGWIDTRTKDSA